jgi:hypothetical protein
MGYVVILCHIYNYLLLREYGGDRSPHNTDASSKAIGAVLMQKYSGGEMNSLESLAGDEFCGKAINYM